MPAIEKIIDVGAIFDTMNRVYIPLYFNKNRYLIIYGGAGSGKSRWVGQKLIVRMLAETPHRILVARKVGNTIRKSAFQLIVDYIAKYKLGAFFKVRKGDLVIECVNGNMIYFVGLDDVEKLKSIEGITSIWIEEASEITKDDFMQLDLRLRGFTKNYQQIILTFNPISSTHWIKKHFFDQKIPDTKIVKTTYKDNMFIDERYKELLESLAKTDPKMYKIYALGDWGTVGEMVFRDYQVIDSLPDAPTLRSTYGVDFGFTAPSAIVDIRYDEKTGALYFDEVVYQTNLTKDELIRLTKSVAPHLMNYVGYGDAAEPDAIAEFNRAGFKMKPAHKEVLMGIDFINRNNVYVTRRSKNIMREWDSYEWKRDKFGNPIDEPVKANDHSLDALRYGAYSAFGVVRDSKGVVTDKMYASIKKFSGY